MFYYLFNTNELVSIVVVEIQSGLRFKYTFQLNSV